jgi:hypothetical protein
LVEQLTGFPCGEHDDGPDALEVGFRLACEQLSQRAEEEEYLLAPAQISIEYRAW